MLKGTVYHFKVVKLIYRCWSIICCHPGNVFFRDGPAYFSKTMPNNSLASLLKSVGTRLACLQSRPVSHWKCVAHFEVQNTTMEILDCWATEVTRQARKGKNSASKTSTISVISLQTLTEYCQKERRHNTVVNMTLSELFWNLLQALNSELVYIYTKTINFFNLNMKYLVFVLYSIEYRSKKALLIITLCFI